MRTSDLDAQLYSELLVYLLKTGVRPLKEREWSPFPAGLLMAEPLSSHEKAAELLQQAGVLILAEGANKARWGPFVLAIPISEIPAFAQRSNAPSLDELLGGFIGMCMHCVGPAKVQPRWYDPRSCHADDTLTRLLMDTGRLVRTDQGHLRWSANMTEAMVAQGEFDDELDS